MIFNINVNRINPSWFEKIQKSENYWVAVFLQVDAEDG
jgi:hypothetical protein